MTRYPAVISEHDTLRLVLEGRSLARYGDGEFKLARGGAIKSQPAHPHLAARLSEILKASGECLVGIPNIHSDTPKAEFWTKHLHAAELLSDRPYVSSFISRPDSAPWINTDEYWQSMSQFWIGRDITIVRGSGKAFTPELMTGAKMITEIIGPRYDGWSAYASLLDRIGHPDRVLISLGPTATVMAVDLCARGVHAIDLGHAGAFYRRWRQAPEVVA